MRYISVAIPHYNNSAFMHEALEPIIDDDRVSEIVICDDKSNDLESLVILLEKLNNQKIRLIRNPTNLGCYHNKLNSMSKCTNDWALLLDSDNVVDTKFLDTLYKITGWNKKLIYTPMWAYTFPDYVSPHLNFTEYKNLMIGPKEFLQYVSKRNFKCLINDCNYFAPVKPYIECMSKYKYDRKIIDSLDAAILFTDWLYNGNHVYVVENLLYKHRLHSNSNYVNSPARKYEPVVYDYILKRMSEKA